MKRSLLAAAFFAASVALAPTAGRAAPLRIQAHTAGELADACAANPKDPAGDAKINFCLGFAQGAVDVELRHVSDKKPFCFPNPAPTRMATMAQFVDWVRALPAHRGLQATDGLFQFLGERFPCK